MGRWGLLLVLLLAGCSDPETSRLAVGSKGFLVDRSNVGEVMVMGPDRAFFVGIGTHVTVADDTAEPSDPRALTTWRKVKIHVEEGPAKGSSGQVDRRDIHPE